MRTVGATTSGFCKSQPILLVMDDDKLMMIPCRDSKDTGKCLYLCSS